MPLDLDLVHELIREEDDPVELQRKLKQMIEEAHPAPAFQDGEAMPMHVFVDRFKCCVCHGNESTFWRWPVRVVCSPGGELLLALGTSWVGK